MRTSTEKSERLGRQAAEIMNDPQKAAAFWMETAMDIQQMFSESKEDVLMPQDSSEKLN